ncbi:MAG TPA: TetR/AcrR family transcriptional regulator [Kineosporiaceae bacterium]|nr:TetR/AcrR family transcriptional regulator [Kineosporiaceae bacterium]
MSDSDGQLQLPDVLARAWGLPVPGKGPRPGLALDRIVDAAVELAADEGIKGVSMSRVAERLGVSTMGLYRYVASKDDLVLLMVDAAWGPPPAQRRQGETWRQGLERWAWTQRERLNAHPWVLAIPISALPSTPNEVGWLEDGLATMADTRLRPQEKISVILLVSGYVRNEASLMAGLATALSTDQTMRTIMTEYGRILRRVTDPARFPAVHEVLRAGAFEDDDDPDAEFVFGLERVLDGVEALVRAREDDGPDDDETGDQSAGLIPSG